MNRTQIKGHRYLTVYANSFTLTAKECAVQLKQIFDDVWCVQTNSQQISESIRSAVSDENHVYASTCTDQFKGVAVLHVYCGQDKTWKQTDVLIKAMCAKFLQYNDNPDSQMCIHHMLVGTQPHRDLTNGFRMKACLKFY